MTILPHNLVYQSTVCNNMRDNILTFKMLFKKNRFLSWLLLKNYCTVIMSDFT